MTELRRAVIASLVLGTLHVCCAALAAAQQVNPATVIHAEACAGCDVTAALNALELDPRSVGINLVELDTFDTQPRRLPIVSWALSEPLKTRLLGGYVAGAFSVEAPADCVDGLAQMSRWLGKVVRRGLIGDPIARARAAAAEGGILAAIERVYTVSGKAFSADRKASITAQLADVPPEQLEPVVVLLQVICDAHEWVDLALETRPDAQWRLILDELRKTSADDDDENGNGSGHAIEEFSTKRRVADAVRGFDSSLLFVGAEEIVFAVDALHEHVRGLESLPGWSLVVPTPMGVISIGRMHDLDGDTIAPLLLIDWNGDDLYSVLAANSAPDQLVSVAVDFGGDDQYVNTKTDTGNFGAGHLGIGMLFDFAGNDEYRITRNGLANGLLGVGLLYDGAGHDLYVAVENAQAAATGGAALLVDRGGRDRYELYTMGQGYGGPGGCGVLADVAGDDRYTANDEDIRFPAPQSDKHNVSLAQGAGYGWRGDYLQGLSTAGGVGVLFDGGGDDAYSCGVFGQGVGYWFGLGLLVEGGGADAYVGQWYVQGASAHFAAGILLETAGDDRYDARMNMAHGAGHDVGVGVFVDEAGDDHYTCGTLALGAGNAGGLGWFLDRSGRDTYEIVRGDNNMGYASPNRTGTLRAAVPGVGLFLDLAGDDTYPKERGGNLARWGTSPKPPANVMRGVARALDCELVVPVDAGDLPDE